MLKYVMLMINYENAESLIISNVRLVAVTL
jgi:hypothetical protein